MAWFDEDRGKGVDGRYVLLQDEEPCLERELGDPNDGKVANNGTFLLLDDLSHRRSKNIYQLHVWDANGNSIVDTPFAGHGGGVWLSPEGDYLLINTEEETRPWRLFSLPSGNIVSRIEPATEWTGNFSVDAETRGLRTHFPDGRTYRYAADGHFLDAADKAAFELDRDIDGGRGYAMLERAQQIYARARENTSLSDWEEIDDLLKRATTAVAGYPNATGIICRAWGEMYEVRGNASAALEYYRRALAANPKVGLKRRVEALQKRVGEQSK